MSQPILQQVESQNKQGGIERVVRFVCGGSNKPRPRPRCGLTYYPQLLPVLRRIRPLLFQIQGFEQSLGFAKKVDR
jgi:hypothetical protein